MTLGQLLLFENNDDIEDSDQVEIMREALHYFENPISGVRGYLNMKPGWKALSEKINLRKVDNKTISVAFDEAKKLIDVNILLKIFGSTATVEQNSEVELNNLPKVYGVVILLCITFIIVKIFGMFNMKLEV
jgi:hypothetical protein